MTFSQNKKVSVIVPNYNYERYLEKRIRSILRQTYPIYELIVLDDASTDGSVEKLKELAKKINFKLITNEKNSGRSILQWKKAFEEASGDYIWIAEADDLARRDFLQIAMKGFEDPGVVLSYTESAVINGQGILMAPNFRWSRDKEKTGHYKKSYIKDGLDEIREIMAIRCSIPNVSAVVFKNDKKFIKYLDEAAKFSQVGDWYFYVKILENGKISYNRRALNLFRVHKGSVTGKSKSGKKHFEEVKEMHQMMQKYDLDKKVKAAMMAEEERISSRL